MEALPAVVDHQEATMTIEEIITIVVVDSNHLVGTTSHLQVAMASHHLVAGATMEALATAMETEEVISRATTIIILLQMEAGTLTIIGGIEMLSQKHESIFLFIKML